MQSLWAKSPRSPGDSLGYPLLPHLLDVAAVAMELQSLVPCTVQAFGDPFVEIIAALLLLPGPELRWGHPQGVLLIQIIPINQITHWA